MDSQEVFLHKKQCLMLKGLNVLVVPCSAEESTLKVSSPLKNIQVLNLYLISNGLMGGALPSYF